MATKTSTPVAPAWLATLDTLRPRQESGDRRAPRGTELPIGPRTRHNGSKPSAPAASLHTAMTPARTLRPT